MKKLMVILAAVGFAVVGCERAATPVAPVLAAPAAKVDDSAAWKWTHYDMFVPGR